MKKKAGPKKIRHNKKSPTYFYYAVLTLAVVAVLASGKMYSGITKPHVLGASTGPVLLADHGGDSGGDSNGGDGGSGSGSSNPGSSSQDSGSGSSGGGSTTSGDSGNNNSESSSTVSNNLTTSTSVADSTKVDCIGPDGRHFITEFHDCQELNQKWGNSTFNFTPLATQTENKQEKPEPSVTPEQKDTTEQTTGKVEVQTEGNKGELNLQSQGLHIEIKREDNGQVTIHAHQEGGREITLKSDALDQINQTLKDQEVEVSTTSANTLTITSHNVAAHTTLPISIDPSTNTLAITTPAGTKDVNVLPNKAVESLISSRVLSNVLSESSSEATNSANPTTVIGLTTQNSEPVFQVQGVKEKRLLGIFPVAFPKTVTVSAQTGQVLNTQESLINKFLESLSI